MKRRARPELVRALRFHGKCDAVTKPGLAAMVVKDGVDFDSLDGEPVTLLFLIAAPNTEDNVHLDVLSKLSVLMMDEDFSESLRNAKTVDEFLNIIDKADDEKPDIDERLETAQAAKVLGLLPVRQELHIRIWRLKAWRKQQKQQGLPLRSRHADLVVLRMC